MKTTMLMFAVLAWAAVAPADAAAANPIEKVLEMLADLQAKVIAEGEGAQKRYDAAAEWCEDKATNLGFEIKTGKAEVAELSAVIEEETARIAELGTKIEDLSTDIKTAGSDLDKATKIRARENADFKAEEAELTEVLDMLERATSILTKGNGAAMLQLKSARSLADALGVMVQASALSSADASRLTALVQTSEESSTDDADEDAGAPAAAVYEGHSDGIIGTLEGLTDKAQGQLDKARKAETTSAQNFEMLKQSLTDEMKFAEKDLDKSKKDLAESTEKKAVAEGDLQATSKDLAEDIKEKASLHQNCMSAAEEFELSTKSRGEELSALASAKKVIQETTGGAAAQSYGFSQVSLLQVASGTSSGKYDVVHFIRDLARKSKSPALAQLVSRVSSAVRLGTAAGGDPFAKVKGLITDMISTLEQDAEDDASHKAFCDKEMSEASAKKEDLTAESDKLSTKIAQDKAASAKLKEQVATLQKELALMAKARAEADALREEEKTAYEKNSAEMKQGVEGVKLALKVLKEYYAKEDKSHDAGDGAGAGIIGLLEVVESDFTKGLTEMTAEEETAATEYDAYVKEDDIATTLKTQDVKYKNKEAASLDKSVSELSTDLSSVTDELSAVLKALDKLKEMCIAKAEPYAERKARREAELAGLKEALQILEGEAALIQTSTKHMLRGVRRH